jgi:ABC-type nickel/cobalt efflux system permease component RcnA
VSRSRFPRRVAVLVVLAAALLAAGAAPAAAHPLGNFTVNLYSGLRVQPDRLVVDHVLDMAEIPAFQTRQAIDGDHDGRVGDAEATAWRDRECQQLAAGLRASLDGRTLRLAATGPATLTFPRGTGGLSTLRLECVMAAPLLVRRGGHDLAYADANLPGRVGWREITAVGDGATLEAADVPTGSASGRLTAYPEDQLRSPLDRRQAALRFHPGGARAGAATAPGAPVATGRRGVDRATAAFTALVAERRFTLGFGAVAVLLAVVLGAAHALAPGHGKTVMAAYLVGLRGSLRQAITIGATVTVTHTAGVLLLGLALTASRAVASERIYPWLGLASGLLLASVGTALVARALTGSRHRHDHHGPAGHDHHGPAGHDHHGPAGHDHHGPAGHDHHGPAGHDHHGPAGQGAGLAGRPLGRRGLVALGLAGGLVPSPSAVVVLLGGIAIGHAWFGVALVLAYGIGMAATLTGIGLLLAQARSRVDRRLAGSAGSLLATAGRLLPVATAAVIVVVGLALAAQGAAQL